MKKEYFERLEEIFDFLKKDADTAKDIHNNIKLMSSIVLLEDYQSFSLQIAHRYGNFILDIIGYKPILVTMTSKEVETLLNTLTDEEEASIIRDYYGLNENGKKYSEDDIAYKYSINPFAVDRIRNRACKFMSINFNKNMFPAKIDSIFATKLDEDLNNLFKGSCDYKIRNYLFSKGITNLEQFYAITWTTLNTVDPKTRFQIYKLREAMEKPLLN